MANDERYLMKQAKEGNAKALEELVKENSGLIWSIVKKFLGRGYERDDLYQIGSIGFIKSVKRFDLSLSYKLSTFAVPYIMGEIKKFIRDDGIIKISRRIKELGINIKISSINEEIFDDGKEEKIERIENRVDESSKIVDILSLKDMIENLDSRDKKIIELRYFKEKTQGQVGEILGISQVQVSRIEKRILENMREEMAC